ncbi:hypothetical protein BX666DRAFT_1239619 [Dichotomocladium elegans]|nr:hypothetical protein BX666DRAFT_1239619 [Dichotomocladium elegans]
MRAGSGGSGRLQKQHTPLPMFPVYSEKILKKRATKIVWCPTSDLAAILYHDNTIALCRDGTSPVWDMPSPDESAVTALAWDPNGHEFVIGSESGLVTRVDATCYKPKSSTCWQSPGQSSITSLAWVKFSKREEYGANQYGFDPSVFDFDNHLPPLSMEPPDQPAPLIPNAKQVKPPLPDPPRALKMEHTLLLIGDSSGHVYLW